MIISVEDADMARPKGQDAINRTLLKEAKRTRFAALKKLKEFEHDTGITVEIPDERAYVDAAKRKHKE
jgi:hypothetical protein